MAIRHDKSGKCGACLGVSQFLAKIAEFQCNTVFISIFVVIFYSSLGAVVVQ